MAALETQPYSTLWEIAPLLAIRGGKMKWNKYFEKIIEGDYHTARYKCKLCGSLGARYEANGFFEAGTGQHMKTMHREIYDQIKTAQQPTTAA